MSGIALVGNFENFTGSQNWDTYLERLEIRFVVMKVKDNEKGAILLSCLAPKVYENLRSMMAPNKPITQSYDAIVRTLTNRYQSKPVIAERLRFHNRNQAASESISQYVAELHKLASSCNFKDFLEDAVRDRFVFGIHHGPTKRQLLSSTSDLSLQKAMEVALENEMAAKESSRLQQKVNSSACAPVFTAMDDIQADENEEVEITVELDQTTAQPIRTGENSTLTLGYVLDVLISDDENQRSSSLVPFRPKAGEVYLFKPRSPLQKDYWRVDGHSWVNAGLRSQPKKNPMIKKSYFHLRMGDGRTEKGFRREAYWLLDKDTTLVLVHYSGDDRLSARSRKPHKRLKISSMPSVLSEIEQEEDSKSSLVVYQVVQTTDQPEETSITDLLGV